MIFVPQLYEGSDDGKIFEFAQAEEAVFLTTDRDFFHTLPHMYEKHHGVIVVALKQPNRREIQKKIEWVLLNFEIAEVENHVLLLRDQHFTRLPKE